MADFEVAIDTFGGDDIRADGVEHPDSRATAKAPTKIRMMTPSERKEPRVSPRIAMAKYQPRPVMPRATEHNYLGGFAVHVMKQERSSAMHSSRFARQFRI